MKGIRQQQNAEFLVFPKFKTDETCNQSNICIRKEKHCFKFQSSGILKRINFSECNIS